MNKDIFYSLNTADIQTVAQETLGRELSENELLKVKEQVPEDIKWFDIIENIILGFSSDLNRSLK